MTLSVSLPGTRLSQSFVAPIVDSVLRGMLIRIHPVNSLGEPFSVEPSGLTIGRDDRCTISIDDDSISRRHACIEWYEEGYILRDLESTNGTFVNEQRITEMRLCAGDRIRFGKHIFKYLSSEEMESQYHEAVFKMMTSDGLTQVYNKRYFAESLERELANVRRTNEPLCVLLMDLDKFKSINDTHGHLAGDAVLVDFATRVKSILRGGELLARYGGEEFVIMCPRTSLDVASYTAERIRAFVASNPVKFEGKSIPVTVSIGISECNSAFRGSLNELVAVADKHLYRSKELGRDQVQYEGKAV